MPTRTVLLVTVCVSLTAAAATAAPQLSWQQLGEEDQQSLLTAAELKSLPSLPNRRCTGEMAACCIGSLSSGGAVFWRSDKCPFQQLVRYAPAGQPLTDVRLASMADVALQLSHSNRTLAFAGDSITSQIAEGGACSLLRTPGFHLERASKPQTLWPGRFPWRLETVVTHFSAAWTDDAQQQQQHGSAELAQQQGSAQEAPAQQRQQQQSSSSAQFALWRMYRPDPALEGVDAMLRSADIWVINFGLHWKVKEADAYATAVGEILLRVCRRLTMQDASSSSNSGGSGSSSGGSRCLRHRAHSADGDADGGDHHAVVEADAAGQMRTLDVTLQGRLRSRSGATHVNSAAAQDGDAHNDAGASGSGGAARGRRVAVWRETSAQHFALAPGGEHGGASTEHPDAAALGVMGAASLKAFDARKACSAAAWYPGDTPYMWREGIVLAAARAAGLTVVFTNTTLSDAAVAAAAAEEEVACDAAVLYVVPFYEMTRLLGARGHHISAQDGSGGECTHYCGSPFVWERVYDGVHRAIAMDDRRAARCAAAAGVVVMEGVG